MNRFRSVGLCVVAGLLVCVSFLAMDCFAPSKTGDQKQSSCKADFDDPLPAGAIARIGTTQLRSSGSLAVTHDGKLMASSFGGRLGSHSFSSVCVWETKTGNKRLEIDCEDTFVALSLEGTVLATCGKRGDMGVRLWDVQTGKLLRQIQIESKKIDRTKKFVALPFYPKGNLWR